MADVQPKMARYKMKTSAGTQGAISKRWHSWQPGSIITAPLYEFRHLDAKHYTLLPDETSEAPPAKETAGASPGTQTPAVNATAGAIELAQELGLDLAGVAGTGSDGKITKADVEKHLNE